MSSREKRLKSIEEILKNSKKAVSGTDIASSMDVSRQAIVQDIATLRERGLPVISTSEGYHIDRGKKAFRRVLAVRHSSEQLFKELSLIVERGGRVLDVFIDHPVYGELRGNINVGSLEELNRFMTLMETTGRKPLLTLSDGFHLHTVEASSEESLDSIEESLREAGYIAVFS